MKIALLGDLQAKSPALYPATDKDGVNLRLLDVIHELDRIRQVAAKREVEAVCVLGDIFDQRNTLDVIVLNQVYRAFRRYVDSGLRLIVLVGNHDRVDVGHEHSLEVFKSFCTVVDTPQRIVLRGGIIVAIPFDPTPQKVEDAIAEYVTDSTNLLLLHEAIQEVWLPNGKVWGEGIRLNAIPPHVITLAGHFHRWREVREGNVYYVGSLQQVDRGDTGIVKYYAVYNSETHTVVFPKTHGPQFVNLDVPFMPDVDLPAGRYTQEEFHEAFAIKVQGNFVTVQSIPPNWTDNAAIQRALLALGARQVDLAFHTEMPIVPPQLLGKAETPAAVAVVEEYVASADTTLDKTTLVEQAIEIIEDVAGDDLLVEVE